MRIAERKKVECEKNSFISKNGWTFNINDFCWQLNKNIIIYVKWMSRLKSIVRASLKMVLARCAEEYSAETVNGLNNQARLYFNYTGDCEFLINSLISYRSMLSHDKEYCLATIRMLVRTWYDWGYPGVCPDVIVYFDNLRLKGMEKGKAIKSMDPENGPLTEIEMGALIDAMQYAYFAGYINITDYVLATTLFHTGRRPIQITSLKIKDVFSRKINEVTECWINFPRAKQRFSRWRTEFTAYPITEEFMGLLNKYVLILSKRITKLVGFKLTEEVIQELPLFPDFDLLNKYRNLESLKMALLGDELHIHRNWCNQVVKMLGRQLNVYSERTGKKLNLSIRRFRYTLGSNLAREGKGELIIAEALDHSDTQNVGVYVKNLPDVVERIDKAVALQLAPLAQAFQGVLIESEADAKRGSDKNSRIGNADVTVGNCGSYGFCSAMAPIACYTCKHFQPWFDGPHEIILDELLEKRDEVFRDTQDIKIASTNDRLILAVAQVIRCCNEQKSDKVFLEVF
ncbi:TPA: site-specific integrase [Salmonella enterica]|nr:site-specific integrase [Salmonella enterica]HDC1601935.1 site-specific integrase [Salmonella enterica]